MLECLGVACKEQEDAGSYGAEETGHGKRCAGTSTSNSCGGLCKWLGGGYQGLRVCLGCTRTYDNLHPTFFFFPFSFVRFRTRCTALAGGAHSRQGTHEAMRFGPPEAFRSDLHPPPSFWSTSASHQVLFNSSKPKRHVLP